MAVHTVKAGFPQPCPFHGVGVLALPYLFGADAHSTLRSPGWISRAYLFGAIITGSRTERAQARLGDSPLLQQGHEFLAPASSRGIKLTKAQDLPTLFPSVFAVLVDGRQ